jgi:glycerol kinase
MLMNTGTTPIASKNNLLTTVAWRIGNRTEYALEGSIFIAGAVVQWLRDGLGIIGSAAEIEDLAASVPDSGGVVFVPALTGLGAPDWDPTARGMIIGLTRGTTAAHIARATLEAIANEVRDVVELMSTDGRVPLTCLGIDGGAAANDLLCQLQADTLRLPVDRSAELQTTGLGAAFLAGLGVGMWSSFDELATTRHSSGLFEPRPIDPRSHERWRAAVWRAKGWAT